MTTANNLMKSALLMATIVIGTVGCWELYLRQKGTFISYDDEAELWSDKRARVYEPSQKTTVFIGSSRIKYDLSIDTWKRITGKDAIQLAIEGNSPLAILEDLGNDQNFRGNLVIDATELLFFTFEPQFNAKPEANISYYHKQTYAQKASFQLNRLLESQFVFLNKSYFSLNAELGNLPIQDRPGIMGDPRFPIDFSTISFDREDRMNPIFLSDTAMQNQVRGIWSYLINKIKTSPPPKENPIPVVLQKAKKAIDQIRKRGGDAVFIRPPSSGPFFIAEQDIFKRQFFWDPLLATTQTNGIYFTDYPTLNILECKEEWSHLNPAAAKKYTKELIKLLPSKFTN
jgi:hypothetical protein